MLKVPFTKENIVKCVCGKCPVQAKSQCSKEKMAKAQKIMAKYTVVPMPQAIPGLYCSSGEPDCKDLDFKEMCICGTCLLWTKYNLPAGAPIGYYCRDGESK